MPATKKVRSASADISKRSRSRFSHLTDVGTTLATVFSYLNGELIKTLSQREGKQRAADALLAFWKPYALQAQKVDANRVQNAAQSSIEALFRQMQTICDDFEVELPIMRTRTRVAELSTVDLEAFAIAVAKQIGKTAEPIPPVISIAASMDYPPVNQQLLQENDAIFVNDEDLLGDLE